MHSVVSDFRHVFFHPEVVAPAVELWGSRVDPVAAWSHPCHPSGGGENNLQWLFVLDVLNHCFWADKGSTTWSVEYGGESHSGYWGLAACLMRAVYDKIPITDAAFLAGMNERDAEHLFRGQGCIPLRDERLCNLREAGRVLLERWNGHIVNLLEHARRDALDTVVALVESFPSFRDEGVYHGRRVFFWKRAQLFVSDVHHAFSGKDWGAFMRMEHLTAFADYKLPQVLRELGVLSYAGELAEKVDRQEEITHGCPDEIGIRATTIWAVEHLKEEFQRRGRLVDSVWVDNWLWNLGQDDRFRRKPYHRCRTIYY